MTATPPRTGADDRETTTANRNAITPERIKAVKGLYQAGHSEQRISRLSSLDLETVKRILDGTIGTPKKNRPRGEELRNAVRDLTQSGVGGREIARRLGRSHGYVSILRRRMRS